jgi:hypothetical protein
MRYPIIVTALALTLTSGLAAAHHSFAVYDIDNKISRTGVLKKFEFKNPHIKIVLDAMLEDGSKETWVIESMNPRRWDSFDYPRDFIKVGDKVTLLGWPARDGKDEMALSAIVTDKGELVVIEQVRQRRAREDIPEEATKRE